MGHHLIAESGKYELRGRDVSLRLNPELQFAEGGEVLRLVTTFLAAYAGLTAVFDRESYPAFPKDPRGIVEGVARGETHIDLAQVVQRVRAQAIDQTDATSQLCCMLTVAAWEALSLTGSHHRPAPDVQLFYHLRNAAAHGNKWTFDKYQPARPAEWRHLKLDHLLHCRDNPANGRRCFFGDVLPGDLLLLLMDIDSKLHPGAPKVVLEDRMEIRSALTSPQVGTSVGF